MTKAEALEDIAKRIAKAPCPLRKTATRAVPGAGSPKARIVFVGEAPGRNEDKTGLPFIGAAGKVLDGLLESIGVKREDVFITSIEKFRPPNNRDPLPKEVEVCFPFLEEQLAVIKPDVVVTLGRHAMRWIVERYAPEIPEADINISKLHGKKITRKGNFMIFPMYHPAAALYQRTLLATLQQDFKTLGAALKKK